MTNLIEIVEHSPRLTSRTKQIYLSAIKQFLSIAGTSPNNWTVINAQKFYDFLLTRMRPQSANTIFYALRYVAKRYAQLNNDPRLNFAAGVELAKNDQPAEKRALSNEEIRALFASCAGKSPADMRDAAILAVGFKTGLRRFSIAGIEFKDFGRDPRGYAYVTCHLKGGRKHNVPLSEFVVEYLQPWLNWLSANGIQEGAVFRRLGKKNLSGRQKPLNGLSPNGIYQVTLARARLAGVKFHPHLFRHTFITKAKDSGMTNEAVAAITGHSLERGASVISKTYTDKTVFGAAAADSFSWED